MRRNFVAAELSFPPRPGEHNATIYGEVLGYSQNKLIELKVRGVIYKGKTSMDCCQCRGIETKFDQKYVAKKLKKYRKNDPKKTTWLLIEALRTERVAGLTLLDIGGGVGDIQHELLRSGVSSAIDSEASTAYLEACRQEAERLGHSDRIRHIQGDFVQLAQDISPTDIVTLDRVICCYHDMPNLVNLSAQRARRFYGIVYPLDRWWIRVGVLVY